MKMNFLIILCSQSVVYSCRGRRQLVCSMHQNFVCTKIEKVNVQNVKHNLFCCSNVGVRFCETYNIMINIVLSLCCFCSWTGMFAVFLSYAGNKEQNGSFYSEDERSSYQSGIVYSVQKAREAMAQTENYCKYTSHSQQQQQWC